MFSLKPETKANICNIIGMDVFNEDIDYNEEVRFIEQKIDKKLGFPNSDSYPNRIGRGNPLLAHYKIKTMQKTARNICLVHITMKSLKYVIHIKYSSSFCLCAKKFL